MARALDPIVGPRTKPRDKIVESRKKMKWNRIEWVRLMKKEG